MAISLLQDAQTRSLAAALAGIKCEEVVVDRSLSLSPPMSANNSVSSNAAIYPGLQQAAAASAFGMLSPTQLLAANRQAAAAFMAAQLPMSTLATTLFPHHPATLFGSWAAQQPPTSTHMHSPPASPHSPIANTPIAVATKHALTSPTSSLNAHSHVHNGSGNAAAGGAAANSSASGGCAEQPIKKARKLTVKKEFQTPNNSSSSSSSSNNNNNSSSSSSNNNNNGIQLSMSVSDLYNTPGGPISPPSSGSSPNSTHDGPTSALTQPGSKDAARDKSFTCKTCSRSFGYKHVLQNHERTHTGEKPFECPECHKRFTRDHHLKTHMRLHTGEKPYHCSHCDRQFVQVANLRRHLRVHTGERPYICEICDGKFSDSNQLKSHMLVHNGEKPFECERCHMKFRRRHHLMNHKCGIQSPPTPALSPAMSGDYPMGETPIANGKYTMASSYGSEESMDLLAKSTLIMPMNHIELTQTDEDAPLDLSEDGGSSVDGNCSSGNATRSRKANDIRRVFRLPPPQILHVNSDMPEQTEPEDLSMHSPRSNGGHSTPESMHMLHDDIDLDDLDDAATLYMRQQQQLAAAAALKRSMHLV